VTDDSNASPARVGERATVGPGPARTSRALPVQAGPPGRGPGRAGRGRRARGKHAGGRRIL